MPLAAGVDHTVDHLVPQQAGTAQLAESDVRITVEGVRTLTDYASIGRLLQATPGIRRASLLGADPGTVLFLVTVRGGAYLLLPGLSAVRYLAALSGGEPGNSS